MRPHDAPHDDHGQRKAGGSAQGTRERLSDGAGSLELTGILRRAELALQARPAEARLPPLRLLAGELASMSLLGTRAAPGPPPGPARQPRAVMLLPGFLAHTAMMYPLAMALDAAGHRVTGWGYLLNLGATRERLEELGGRIERLGEREGRKITLVGWSLGGLFAREVARLVPGSVQGVVTMGSPFSGDRRANRVWRLYQFLAGHDVDEPPVDGDIAEKPPVPTTALWSPRDGIIAPRSAAGWPDQRDRAVALRCTHMGFVSDPDAIAAVLRELDRED